jgi:hypothetical protein
VESQVVDSKQISQEIEDQELDKKFDWEEADESQEDKTNNELLRCGESTRSGALLELAYWLPKGEVWPRVG